MTRCLFLNSQKQFVATFFSSHNLLFWEWMARRQPKPYDGTKFLLGGYTKIPHIPKIYYLYTYIGSHVHKPIIRLQLLFSEAVLKVTNKV